MPNIRLGPVARFAPAALLLLAACQGKGPLDKDLQLVGMEPFWAVVISREDQTVRFSRAGNPDMDAGYPVQTESDDAIILTSSASSGDIVMTLREGECMDGMSDREYPWEAEVVYNGETLRGCAGPRETAR